MSPYKVREILDLVRGKPVHEAEDILRFSERDAAFTVLKLLRSAIANAENNDELEAEELYVSACYADEGTTIKRWRPRARGRATRIRKRTCHITVIVSRLSERDLVRLQARRRAEQLAQRSRRVAGARRSEGDTRNRSDRRRGVFRDDAETAEHDHDHDHDHDDETVTGEAETPGTETPEAETPESETPESETAETETSETPESDTAETETAETEPEETGTQKAADGDEAEDERGGK
jgi:large subunit ribosomal protein L22